MELASESANINVEKTAEVEKNVTKEEIKEETNITEIPEIINVTEKENITFYIIQNVPDITIRKNQNYILDLSQYFSGAESYSVFELENISVELEGEIANITTD